MTVRMMIPSSLCSVQQHLVRLPFSSETNTKIIYYDVKCIFMNRRRTIDCYIELTHIYCYHLMKQWNDVGYKICIFKILFVISSKFKAISTDNHLYLHLTMITDH